MFTFCPSCASRRIACKGHVFDCPDCGFHYYHNTAAASGCIIRAAGGAIVLLERGKEPARGKLDLPGGFVNPGEGILEGLRRELREELGWEPPPAPAGDPRGDAAVFRLVASFPNTYPYRGIVYNTCDLFFSVDAPSLRPEDLTREEAEVAGVRFIPPALIRGEDIAFESARHALQVYASSPSVDAGAASSPPAGAGVALSPPAGAGVASSPPAGGVGGGEASPRAPSLVPPLPPQRGGGHLL